MIVTVKRHIAKSITYRCLGTLTTVMLAMFAGLSIEVAGMVGIAELIVKPIVYFIHERVWYKWVKFGLKKQS